MRRTRSAAAALPRARLRRRSPPAREGSWAQPQIKLVTARGLMGGDAVDFKPDAPLTQGALAELVAELDGPGTGSSGRARRRRDDDGARRLARQGARPRRRRSRVRPRRTQRRACATEPLRHRGRRRLLGLRTNHPTGQDSLELLPERPGDTRRSRLLGRADPRLRATGRRRACANAAPRLRAPEPHAWQRQILRTPSRSSAIRTSGAGRARSRRRRSASRLRAASTAPASSGASTSSRPIRARRS